MNTFLTEVSLSPVPDPWPRVLIGITGRKGHGKDTAAEALLGFEVVKFAGALKAALRAYMVYVGLDRATIDRMIEGDLKEQPADCFRGRTPRYAMQTFGTEWGRDTIGSDIWTEAFRERAKQFERVVCTDVRFPNEVALIRSMGGVTVRIVRPNAFYGADFNHVSERYIDGMPVDHEILNNGSISELRTKMRELFLT